MTRTAPRRSAPFPLALALAAGLAGPAAAQDAAQDPAQGAGAPATGETTTAPAPAPAPATTDGAATGDAATGDVPTGDASADAPTTDGGLSLGEPAPEAAAAPAEGGSAIGDTYVREEFTDWQMRCVRVEPGTPEPCQLYQLLRDETGNPVAEISMFGLPTGGQAAAGATVITPLETLLTEQLTVQVDTGQAKRYPFTWCSAIGCFARIGFTDAEIAQFKRGNVANLSIVPVAAPDQRVRLTMSLAGFTAGLDAVDANNAAARAAE